MLERAPGITPEEYYPRPLQGLAETIVWKYKEFRGNRFMSDQTRQVGRSVGRYSHILKAAANPRVLGLIPSDQTREQAAYELRWAVIRGAEQEFNTNFERVLTTAREKFGSVQDIFREDITESTIVRWVSAGAAEFLQSHSIRSQEPTAKDYLSRAARHVLLRGAELTAEIDGKTIDKDWLDGLINIVTDADQKLPMEMLHKFESDPPMDLEQARNILQAIVLIPGESISPETPLEQVSGFTTKLIKEAVLAVGKDLMRRYPQDTSNEGGYQIKKRFNRRDLASLEFHNRFNTAARPDEGDSLYFPDQYREVSLDAGHLHASIPLGNPTYGDSIEFSDFRRGHYEFAMPNIHRTIRLEEYRVLFTAIRLVFANMLEWEKPGVIMPEQLDRLFIK